MAANPFDDLLDAAPTAQANPFDDLLDTTQTPQEAQPGMLARGAQWVGRQLDRVPAAIRGGAEAYQTNDPYSAADRAWQGLKDPASVQSSERMMGRFGADTTPRERTLFIPSASGPGPAARVQTNTSEAEDMGAAFDALAPTGLELIPGAKLLAKGASKVGNKALKIGTSAAERSILEKYSMAKAMKIAPSMGPAKTIQSAEEASKVIGDAPKVVADKLREHDLLYNPGKANFNLQRDLKIYGKQIGETVQEMKSRDVSVNIQSVLDDYIGKKVTALKASGKDVGSIEDFQTKIAPKLQSMIDNLEPDKLGRVPIDKAVSFRQDLQAVVKNWGKESPSLPLMQSTARELQYQANQAIAASDRVGGPKLAALNNKFHDLSNLQPLIEDAYRRGFGRAAVGRDVRPLPFTREGLVNRAAEVVGSPVKTIMAAKPAWAEMLANRGNVPAGLKIQDAAIPKASEQEIAAWLKQNAQAIPADPSALPPRSPVGTRRTLGEPKPATYVPRADSDPSALPARKVGNASPGRRPIAPIADDPSLSVEHLGKVMDADAAKEIAATKYQADRLKTLWTKVREAKSAKQRTALMNLIRATHKATPKK